MKPLPRKRATHHGDGVVAPPPTFAVEAASEGIVGIDPKGRIQTWNSGARRVFGYARDEVLGRPLSLLLPPENRRGMRRLLDRLRRDSWVEYGEASCLKKGAVPIDVAFTALPERTLAPERRGILLVIHDITARKRFERELQSRIEGLESAEQVARQGSWQWDVESDVLRWSEELDRMLGLSPGPRRSTFARLLARIPARERSDFAAAIAKTLKERLPFTREHGLLRADGSTLKVLSRAGVLMDAGGRPKLVGTCQEAVDTRRFAAGATGLLREDARLLRVVRSRILFLGRATAILFNTFDHEDGLARVSKAAVPPLADRCDVHLLDDDGTVFEATSLARSRIRRLPAFPGGAPGRVRATGDYEVYQGLRREELAEVLPEPDPVSPAPHSILIVPLRSRKAAIGTLTLVRGADRPPFEALDVLTAQRLAHLASVAVEHGRLYADLFRESEQLRARDREIEALNRDLEARVARRTSELRRTLEELETFAHTVAHDLRAPLRAVSGFLHLVGEQAGERLGPEERDYIARSGEACARMDAFIQDLMAYGQVCHGEVETRVVDLPSAVAEARRRVEADLESRGAGLDVGDLPHPVIAHTGLLVQALANLLSNAAKFVAPGVVPAIRLSAERREGWIRIWVEDNGIGIPADRLGRIFLPFERLHPASAYPGNGLGLPIVRRALERMGGTVGVESTPGVGSRFWIELPAAPA